MPENFAKNMIAIAEGVKKMYSLGFPVVNIDGWYPKYPVENITGFFKMYLENKLGAVVFVGIYPDVTNYYEVRMGEFVDYVPQI